MANQEPARAVEDRFDITLSSVDRVLKTLRVAYMHFRTTYESLPWLRCKSGAKEHLSHNNKRNTDIEQKNWKPCWVRFPGSEKLGASRNGRMERNFPVIPIFRNFRPTSRGTPKISEWNSGKCLFHSLPNPEFPEFLVEWKAPQITNAKALRIIGDEMSYAQVMIPS